ncbi:hypothetical protein AB6A40_003131 [Gnathostoma spinigerum]|uniref:Uncharacterized protein n=1 Tax=Gnathostoma spinigerum TaxID=75299 RepID=A0ABD6EAX1_9BILA
MSNENPFTRRALIVRNDNEANDNDGGDESYG